MSFKQKNGWKVRASLGQDEQRGARPPGRVPSCLIMGSLTCCLFLFPVP